MNKDDVMRWAREAGFPCIGDQPIIACGREELERFAALVAAAKCNELADEAERNGNVVLAQQIRARSDT